DDAPPGYGIALSELVHRAALAQAKGLDGLSDFPESGRDNGCEQRKFLASVLAAHDGERPDPLRVSTLTEPLPQIHQNSRIVAIRDKVAAADRGFRQVYRELVVIVLGGAKRWGHAGNSIAHSLSPPLYSTRT